MKFLITGGCGFLGACLADEVINRGERLVLFDNLSRTGAARNLSWIQHRGDLEFVHGDIRNPRDIAQVIQEHEPDAVFHLAGQVAMTTSLENPALDFEINALGSLNLLEAVRHFAPDSVIIYSSSNKVYGDIGTVEIEEQETRYVAPQWPRGFNEHLPFAPTTPYGCSKACADSYMRDYSRFFGLKTVVFRHSSMYGPRQYATFDQGWIGWFCQQALARASGNSNTFTIAGNGKQVRDVLHADDLVALYFAAVEQPNDAAGCVFNIGGGIDNSLSLLELFSLLEEMMEIRLDWTVTPWRLSDQRVFVADNSRAKRVLNWAPSMPIREGIRSMLEWLRHT